MEPERQLRSTLTPFALEVATALPATCPDCGLHLAVITPAGAALALRDLINRLGLTARKRVRHEPSGGVTWAERPDLFVGGWGGGREDAIVLRSDGSGPVQMSFFRRVSADRVEQTYIVGYAGDRGDGVRRALWDCGIREVAGTIRKATAPAAFVEAVLARGWRVTSENEERWWVSLTLTERP